MVTIEEQQKSIRKAEQELGEAKTTAKQREQELMSFETKARAIRQPGTIEAQFGLSQQYGSGQVGRILPELQRQSARQKKSILSSIEISRNELGSFVSSIEKGESQVKEAKRQVKEYEQQLNIQKQAEIILSSGEGGSERRGRIPMGTDPAVIRAVQKSKKLGGYIPPEGTTIMTQTLLPSLPPPTFETKAETYITKFPGGKGGVRVPISVLEPSTFTSPIKEYTGDPLGIGNVLSRGSSPHYEGTTLNVGVAQASFNISTMLNEKPYSQVTLPTQIGIRGVTFLEQLYFQEKDLAVASLGGTLSRDGSFKDFRKEFISRQLEIPQIQSIINKSPKELVLLTPKVLTGTAFELREIAMKSEIAGIRGDLALGGSVGLFVAGFGATIFSAPGGIYEFGKGLVIEPTKTITSIPGGIKAELSKIGSQLASPTPELALGRIAGELVIIKGTTSLVRGIGNISQQLRTILSPQYRDIGPIREPTIPGINRAIKNIPFGDEGYLDLPITAGEGIKRAVGGFKWNPQMEIPLIDTSFKKAGFGLKTQLSFAGKEVTGVSASTGLFGDIFNRQVTIGSTKGLTPTLESSFFFDPLGRARISRLGVLDTATKANILDILSGDVSFKGVRPQLIVTKGIVEQFPKGFETITGKIAKGTALTSAEQSRLLKFQLKPSGQLKPLGYVTSEAELTLAPKEVLKRGKSLGVTLIEGKRVEIIVGEIASAQSLGIQNIISKPINKLKTADIGKISKATGFSPSSLGFNTKFVSPTELGSGTLSSLSGVVQSPRGFGISFPRRTPTIRKSISRGLTRTTTARTDPFRMIVTRSPMRDSIPRIDIPRATPGMGIPRLDTPRATPGMGIPRLDTPRLDTPKKILEFDFEETNKGRKKSKGKNYFKQKILPSFTALSLDLRGVLPKGTGRFGILPSTLRVIPKRSSKISSRKKRR